MEFTFLERQKIDDALKVNEKLQLKEVKAGPLTYFVIEDFLVNPYDALEIFQTYPALHPPYHSTGPGGRQIISVIEMRPILKVYGEILGNLKHRNINIMNFFTCSNIAYEGMKCSNEINKPHHDVNEIAITLWMSEQKGGTAFYDYHGEPDARKLTTKDYNDAHRHQKQIVTWENFEGDEDWNLYTIVPEKFNSVVIYNGFYFHSMYPVFDKDDYRYNIISFYYPGGIGKTWESLSEGNRS
jgi:hypothetical protein